MLTEEEFATAVEAVVGEVWKVRDASTSGFTVLLTFASNSGKQTIDATLQFDPVSRRLTTIYCPYRANTPLRFADAVERHLRPHGPPS